MFDSTPQKLFSVYDGYFNNLQCYPKKCLLQYLPSEHQNKTFTAFLSTLSRSYTSSDPKCPRGT
jgi:hypothetical protein